MRAADPERQGAGQRFRPSDRIRHTAEFEKLYASGIKVPGRSFTMIAALNGLGHSRLGFALGRKVGGSVERNRVRRRLREIFRKRRGALQGSFDIVILGRPALASQTFITLEREFLERCGQLGRLIKGRS